MSMLKDLKKIIQEHFIEWYSTDYCFFTYCILYYKDENFSKRT